MAILVTGGAGYIGGHMVLALVDAGEQVVVLDDLSTGFAWAVPAAATLVVGDSGDEAKLKAIAATHQIDAIAHFAAKIVVPESVSDPLGYYLNNTVKARTLLEFATRNGIRNFIFSSTAAVYGEPSVNPIFEEAPTAPINPYGRSKLMVEWMLEDAAHAHDLSYVALRYFNVAGADPKGRLGQSTPNATHLIKVAVQAALGMRRGLDIYGTDYATADGTCVRDYIHVSDLANAHVLALEHLIAHPADSLTMNCGYGQGYSVLEVLDAVDRVTNNQIVRTLSPRRAGDPDSLISDNRRIKATLPWAPKFADLDLIVRHALAWERKLGEIRGE